MGETIFTTSNLWLAALVEHERTWNGPNNVSDDRRDVRLFQRTKDLKDSKDATVIRDILKEYKVARNFGVGPTEKNDRMKDSSPCLAEWLVKGADFRGNLVERSQAIENKAAYMEQNNYSRGKPVSGLSKLAWFAAPEGWTMYDSLASTGLLHDKGNPKLDVEGMTRFARFYGTLQKLEFADACDGMRQTIDNSDCKELWPERIFDKAMMILGRRENYRLLNKTAVDVAYNKVAPQLVELAGYIDENLKDKEITQHLKEKWALQ